MTDEQGPSTDIPAAPLSPTILNRYPTLEKIVHPKTPWADMNAESTPADTGGTNHDLETVGPRDKSLPPILGTILREYYEAVPKDAPWQVFVDSNEDGSIRRSGIKSSNLVLDHSTRIFLVAEICLTAKLGLQDLDDISSLPSQKVRANS